MDNTLSLDAQTQDSHTDKAKADAKPRVRTDHHLWGTYILLVIFAVIELFSASIQEVSDGSIFRPILRHGMFLASGLVFMLILQLIHYRKIFDAIPYFVGLCLIAMLAVRVVGTEINGAMRAITIAGIPFLPSEFMKLGTALGMAWILAKNRVKDRRDITTRGTVMCVGFMGVCALLLFSQGLSNTIVVVAISLSMMLIGGMSLKNLA